MASHTTPSTSNTPTIPLYALSEDSFPSSRRSCPQYGSPGANPTISTVRSKIAASASLNSSLLNILMSTMDAPAALGHIGTHISILQVEFSSHSDALEALRVKAVQTLRRHELLRDSIVRRLSYRITAMTAKFQEKANTAQKEYTETVQELSRAEARLKLLESKLKEAEREQRGLANQAEKHGEAHRKIDELYESLFAGPTPGFAEEDRRESVFHVALQENESTKTQLLKVRRALRSLLQAENSLKRAGGSLVHAKDAVDASFFLTLSGADEEIRVHERYRLIALSLIGNAEDNLRPVDRKTGEVKRRLLDTIRESVVDLEVVSSKQALLDSVAHAGKRLNEAATLLDQLKALVKEKEKVAGQDLGLTARALEDARQALQQIRQEAFEKVVGFGAAPPAYHECCNRASQFEEIEDNESLGNAEEEGEADGTIDEQLNVDQPLPDVSRHQTLLETKQPISSHRIPSNASVSYPFTADAWTPSQKYARG